METGESGTSKSSLPFEEERRRIRNLIHDFLNRLKKIQIEEEEFIASKLDIVEKLRMDLRFLRTFVLFGDSSLDDFYDKMSLNIFMFEELALSLFYEDEFIQSKSMAKYNTVHLTYFMVCEITSYLRLKNVGMMTEEKMYEYLFTHLHDLPKYSAKFLLPLMSDYKILRQVCRHLIDFYPILAANRTSTEYLYPRYLMTVQRITQFCLDLWTRKYKEYTKYGDDYDVSQCSSKINSLLIDIIPLELEVLYISTSKLIKESRSTQLEGFVKQILKASPRILQNYLIHLQRCMEGAVAVNYVNVMMEFLLIFLTDIPKLFIHREKLNAMLAHAGVLTRKISILVRKLLEEISENNINEADFSAPDFLQEIEQMKGDIRQIFLKALESSQLRFPMDDGFLFMNLLLRHLNDLLISNVYSVTLIKKEIGMVKESLEFLTSSFGKVTKMLNDTSGVVKDCWLHALDVAYEAEHVINSILVRDKALSHLIFSLPNVTDKIKLIVAQVTGLQLEDKNGDEPIDAKFSNEPIELTSSSFVEVTVGHEEDEARIIGQLLDEHESELDVISYVGMLGLGKTTLANKVYSNTLVASHFNVGAKCTVSQKYNKSKVLQEILQQVPHVSGGNESEDDPADKLRRALLDKRHLIVLDDVWDTATGEMLIACFPKVKRGNRIILTSRNSKVFGDEGSCPAELSEVGHQIVDKCQGLPLAIVLIAGVIVRGKKKEKDLWLQIQDNLNSLISAKNNLEMMKVMQLSYDHLPHHLKPLLLYFGRYRKSKRTPVSTLIQLWMAEGLVDHDSSEEGTQSYLDALISGSLIMMDHIPCESSEPFSVMIKVCYVHDVVHDFCSVKVKKEKLFKLINSGDPFHASDYLHRRLTVHTDDYSQLHKRCVLFNFNKCSAGSKHLISLTVSGYLDDSRLPISFEVLKHWIRYVKAIPVSWLNLQNLETLLINTQYSTMVLLPRILKLSKLKHVSIDQSSFFKEDVDPCRILEGENSKLTTLSHVDISYSQGTNDALKKFPNLQHLECTIRIPEDPPTHGDWFPKFDVLNKFESLFVEYPWKGYVYPNEYHFPSSLKELRLLAFSLTTALLSAIMELPQIIILEIAASDFLEYKWDASEDMYQSLKTLTLRMVNLSEWEADKETFPKLEELILERCYMLTEIPSVFGDIDTLKSIQVVQSKRELGDSAMEIKKDVAAYPGEDRLHVHIS
ncbi:hypothetical protein KY289_022249 [Solanum tuberosum]|nr:hypothetical protein KY289_022249 [Solanum tuberosum]